MRNLGILILMLFFAGCSFRPDVPDIDTNFKANDENFQIQDKWWHDYNDEHLNALVQEALQKNSDLKIAYLNLEKARLSLEISKADLLPSLDIKGDATRSRTSGETNTKQDNIKYNSFSLSGVLSYEIDLWGRVRNSIASNQALLRANEYDLNTSRLSIVVSVIDSYFSLIALKMQEAVYIDTLKSYTDTMNYRKKQLEAGSITKSVYLQSQTLVQSAQIDLNKIQKSIVQASNALAILTNKTNDEILYSLIDVADTLPYVPEVKANISSDILLKRSDVASAYERLLSSNALVGVARAAYFPTLSLTGVFGFSSDALDSLFVQNANMWSIGGSMVQNVFDYSKRANNVELAKLSQSINAINYEKTIKTALSEVRIALNDRKTAIEILKQTKELLNSQQEIFELINAQYDAGYITHLELLDAKRNLLNAKLNAIGANLNLNNSVTQVYRAFGGGFSK
ncbi:efflux transporter outer membrane subunit [Campylobacter majalis]|uniref:efflux transporter outer membrane subunit n=1 Tax=Campylobacter majalis TaxID=2790656 RepID=UPI003D68C514